MPGEYHLWPWRKHSLRQGADAATRTGNGRLSPLPFSPLNSRSRFNSWDSRSKPAPLRLSYATGASATEIVAIYRNGCSVCGESRWSQPSAAKHCRAKSNNGGAVRASIARALHRPAMVGGCSSLNRARLWEIMELRCDPHSKLARRGLLHPAGGIAQLGTNAYRGSPVSRSTMIWTCATCP